MDTKRLQAAVDEINAVIDGERVQEEPGRNADGDTLEDMKTVMDRFNGMGVEHKTDGEWFNCGNYTLTDETNRYRIRAKHADRFDADCMDFETWARAAIGRGMVVRGTWHDAGAETYYYNRIVGMYLTKNGTTQCNPMDCNHNDECWTAITRAQYEQETGPKEPQFIPWTAETFPKDRPVWVGHASSTKSAFLVTYVGPRGISTQGHEMIEWNHLSNYTQHDGAPCGTEA